MSYATERQQHARRDLFAAAALTGLLAAGRGTADASGTADDLARYAWALADGMLRLEPRLVAVDANATNP